MMFDTSIQSNLAKGRIADLSQLADANGFVRSSPSYNTSFVGRRWVSPKNCTSTGSRFWTSYPYAQHTDKDHATCDILSL